MAELTQEYFEEYMESFAKMVKEGFDATASKDELAIVKDDLSGVKDDLASVKAEVRTIRATMVTKDYLDDKFADLRGDLVILMRKEDTKLKKLIEKLRNRNVLDDADVQEISYMEPFAVLHA